MTFAHEPVCIELIRIVLQDLAIQLDGLLMPAGSLKAPRSRQTACTHSRSRAKLPRHEGSIRPTERGSLLLHAACFEGGYRLGNESRMPRLLRQRGNPHKLSRSP